MRRCKTIIGMAMLMLLTAACSEHDRNGAQPGGTNPVLLTVTAGSGIQTRAADGLYTSGTGFGGGERLAVWVKGDGDATRSTYEVGMPSAGKSALTVADGFQLLTYPYRQTATVYAVYPAASTAVHVVRHDQTDTPDGNLHYKESDLMYGRASVAKTGQTEVQSLSLDHQLTRLRVVVRKAATVGRIQGVTLNNVLRRVGVIPSDAGLTIGPAMQAQEGDPDYTFDQKTNSSILLSTGETEAGEAATYTYICVIPAQEWNGDDFLTVAVDGREAVFGLSQTFEGGREYTIPIDIDETSGMGLTKAEAEAKMNSVYSEWRSQVQRNMMSVYWNETESYPSEGYLGYEATLPQGNLSMRIWYCLFYDSSLPQLPEGASLYISLHGGGNSGADFNDGQWNNQKTLYQPQAPCIYVAPRAYCDTWKCHWEDPSYEFYRQIVNYFVAYYDIDPNKVYAMGYSAGGDGTWQIATKLADWWAAAMMCAGHPNAELRPKLLNVRNMPFSLWCGALDTGYQRNELTQQALDILDEYQAADPGGYVHSGQVVAGKPHWMDGAEKADLPWLASQTRNPYPDRVVWHLEQVNFNLASGPSVYKPWMYWIGVPEDEMVRDKEVVASYSGQTVTIERSDYTKLTIYLNDVMMDLDKKVTVMYQGRKVFEGRVKRLESVIRSTMSARNDKYYMFPAKIDVELLE